MGIPKSSQEQGFVDGSLLVASLIHFEWIWRQEWRLNNSCESLLHLSVLITNAVLCEIVAALPAKALHRIETKPMCATKACGKIVAENFPEFGSHTFCTVLVAFVCRHLRQVANDLRMFPTGSGWLRYGRMASNVSYLRARGGISLAIVGVDKLSSHFRTHRIRNESTFKADRSKCTRFNPGVFFLFLVDLRSVSTTNVQWIQIARVCSL